MKTITRTIIRELLEKAAENPRRRTNWNIHETPDDAINRLCIAAMPDSQFGIQRHPGKWELVTCLAGSFISRTYDDAKNILSEIELSENSETRVIEIPAGTWHNVEILTPCVFLEVKPGPYAPVAAEDNLN